MGSVRNRDFTNFTPFIAAWLRPEPSNQNKTNASIVENVLPVPSRNLMRDWQIAVLDNDKCQNAYKGINESVMCADNRDAGKDDCFADAGLMQPLINEKVGTFSYYQTGIVAHGIGCSSTITPVLYTRVQSFIDWIEKNLWVSILAISL